MQLTLSDEPLKIQHILRYAFCIPQSEEATKLSNLDLGRSVWFDTPISGGEAVYADVKYTPGSCKTAERVCRDIINISISSKVPLEAYSKLPDLELAEEDASAHYLKKVGMTSD